MENRSHALIAIIFIVVFAAGAIVIAWWMTAPGAVRVPYVLEAQSSVGGLGEGSAVQFNGVKVGVVDRIHINPRTHRSIIVRIAVNQKFPLPQGSYATIGSSGLIGPAIVDIHLGSSDQIIKTSAEQPARLNVEQGGIGELLANAKSIMSKAQQTLASIQQMMSKQNVGRVTKILENVQTATARLASLEKSIAPAAQQMPELISTTRATMKQARELLARTSRLVAEARAPLSAVGQAADSTASLMAQLDRQTVPRLNVTLKELNALSRRLQALVEELKRAPQSFITGPPIAHPGPGEAGNQN